MYIYIYTYTHIYINIHIHIIYISEALVISNARDAPPPRPMVDTHTQGSTGCGHNGVPTPIKTKRRRPLLIADLVVAVVLIEGLVVIGIVVVVVVVVVVVG